MKKISMAYRLCKAVDWYDCLQYSHTHIVSTRKGFFFPLAVSSCGIFCAAYVLYASSKSLAFLARIKNSLFTNWKPIVSHPDFPDGKLYKQALGEPLWLRQHTAEPLVPEPDNAGGGKWLGQ